MSGKSMLMVFIFLVAICIMYRIMRDPTKAELSNLYSRVSDDGVIKGESNIIYDSLKMY